MQDSSKEPWDKADFRVFLSHTSFHKNEVISLKNALQVFGISCFVAHADIISTKKWQKELVDHLRTMDCLIALITNDFCDSEWTDQEIGAAIVRDITVIPIKIGQTAPYGFIGEIQALSCTWREMPLKVVSLLIGNKKLNKKMMDAYIKAMGGCGSYAEANNLAQVLPFIDKISDDQVKKIISSFKKNDQIKESVGFLGGRWDRIDYEGLKECLFRITGKTYEL